MACQYTYRDKTYSKNEMLEAIAQGRVQLGSINQAKQNVLNLLDMEESDIELVHGLINNQAVGRFQEDGKILLSDMFVQGDEYHEAFHRVFRMMLTDEQRKALLQEYKGRQGFKESLKNKKKLYPEADTDTLIEELLADEFMMYQLADGNYIVPKPVQNFFQRMLAFIRKMLGLKDIEGIYRTIREGGFRAAPVKSYGVKGAEARIQLNYKADGLNGDTLVLELTTDQKNELVEAIVADMMSNLFNDIADKGSFDDIEPTRYLGRAILNVYDALEKDPNKDTRVLHALDADMLKVVNDKLMVRPESKLLDDLNARLSTLNIRLNKDSIKLEEGDDADPDTKKDEGDEDSVGNDYAFMKASWESDPLDHVTRAVKLLAVSIISDTPTKHYKLPKLVPFNDIIYTLYKMLKDTPQNWNNVEAVLRDNINEKPWVKVLLDRLGTVDGVPASEAKVKLRNQFLASLNNVYYEMYKGVWSEDNLQVQPLDENTRFETQIRDMKMRLLSAYKSNSDLLDALQNPNLIAKFKALTGITLTSEILKNNLPGTNKQIGDVIVDMTTVTRDFLQTVQNVSGTNLSFANVFDKKLMLDPKGRDYAILGSLRKVLTVANRYAPNEQGVILNHNNDRVFPFTKTTYQKQIENAINYVVNLPVDEEGDIVSQRIEYLEKLLPFYVQDRFNFYQDSEGNWRTNSVLLNRWLLGDRFNINLFTGMTYTDGVDAKNLLAPDMIPMLIRSALTVTGTEVKYFGIKHGDRGSIFAGSFESKQDYLENVNPVNYLANLLYDELRVWSNRKDYKVFKKMGVDQLKLFSFLNIKDLSKDVTLTPRQLADKYKSALEGYVKQLEDDFLQYLKDVYADASGTIPTIDGVPIYLSKEIYDSLKGRVEPAMRQVARKYIIHYHEDLRVFSGYAGEYPNMANLFKRIQSLSSSGVPLVNDKDTNRIVVESNKKDTYTIDGVSYTYGDPQLKSKGIIKEKTLVGPRTSLTQEELAQMKQVFKDGLINYDKLPETVAEQRAEEWISAFKDYEEADGATYTNMFFYREYKTRLGQWSQQLENTFQFELAILNQNNLDPLVYLSADGKVSAVNKVGYQPVKLMDQEDSANTRPGAFKDMDKKRKKLLAPFTMLKPIYSGPVTHQEVTVNGIRKTSFHLITPSMTLGTGRLKQLHEYMLKNGTDILPLDSATKKAVPANIENIDVEQYSVEDNTFSYLRADYLKEQVAMSNEEKGKIKNATQSVTIMMSNLYNNEGIPKDLPADFGNRDTWNKLSEDQKKAASKIYTAIANYRDALKEVLDKHYDNVKKQLGIDEQGNINNLDRVKESIKAQLSQPNLLAAVDLLDKDTPIDLLASFNRLEPVLFSLVSNEAVRTKRPGEMMAQFSVYGYGQDDVPGQRSNRLQNYRIENGVVKPAEVVIPLPVSMIDKLLAMTGETNIAKAIQKYNKGSNKIIVKSLRIPNQQLSFNGVYAVKEFALPTMQNYIVLPSETVPISSSDFDIDKQQVYMPEIDRSGKSAESVYNRLLGAEIELLLLPENFHTLMAPVNEAWLSKDLFKQVLDAKKVKYDKNDLESVTIALQFSDVGSIAKQLPNAVNMAQSKINVGLVANNAKQYPVSVIDGWTATPRVLTDKGVLANKIPFEGDRSNYYSMYDSDYRHITESVSTVLTSQVDGVKNPYAVMLNIQKNTIGPLMLAIRRGVSSDLMVNAVASPLVSRYLLAKDLFESTTIKAKNLQGALRGKREDLILEHAFGKAVADRIKDELSKVGELTVTAEQVAKSFTNQADAIQVLAAYIHTEKLADEQLRVGVANTPDTKPAQNASAVEDQNQRILELQQSSMIQQSVEDGFMNMFYKQWELYNNLTSLYFTYKGDAKLLYKDIVPAVSERIYGSGKLKVMKDLVNGFKSHFFVKKVLAKYPVYSFENIMQTNWIDELINRSNLPGDILYGNTFLQQLQTVKEVAKDPVTDKNVTITYLKNRGGHELYLKDMYDNFQDLSVEEQRKFIMYNAYVKSLFGFSPFTVSEAIDYKVFNDFSKEVGFYNMNIGVNEIAEYANAIPSYYPEAFRNKAKQFNLVKYGVNNVYNGVRYSKGQNKYGALIIDKLSNPYVMRWNTPATMNQVKPDMFKQLKLELTQDIPNELKTQC